MKRDSFILRCCALCIALSTASHAASAQQLPPIRPLGRLLATSHDTISNVSGVRQLSDGRVLINDTGNRRVLLFDSTLAHARIVADSTGGTNDAYGHGIGGLLAYPGDSTLFVDAVALSFLVIDPQGRIVRVMASPRPNDMASLVNLVGFSPTYSGGGGFDAGGRIVYRPTNVRMESGGSIMPWMNPPDTTRPAAYDSTPIIRVNMVTRAVDTLGFLTTPPVRFPRNETVDGVELAVYKVNPINVYDDWAVLTDGSVAIVRARDYHVEWVNADGTRGATPKMAHEWTRITDSAKAALVDSARQAVAVEQVRNDSLKKALHWPGPTMRSEVVDVDDLPDYRPAITLGAVRADADNNLWIRQTPPSTTAPAIYDIVSRAGQVVDRVQLPPTLATAGFGPGVVYLSVREGAGSAVVKYRIH